MAYRPFRKDEGELLMKKIMGMLVLVLAVMSVGSANAATTSPRQYDLDIKVLYNARQIASDVKPEVKNSTVFVPFRAVSDALGAQLAVTPDWKTITFAKGSRKVTVTIGSKTAVVNGKNVALTVAPYATKGRTMVPTRFVSEQLGEPVEWDSLSRYVWIGHKNVPTLEEATEAVDLEPYLHYFTGKAAKNHLIDWGTNGGASGNYSKVRIIKETDWPLKIDSYTIYRVDRVILNGEEQFRSVSDTKGIMGISFYFLEKGMPLRIRPEISPWREYIGDLRVNYNSATFTGDELVGIDNYMDARVKDVAYVGIFAPSDSVILMENYFK